MVKGIKITTNGETIEFDDNDDEYNNVEKDGYSLMLPERWEHKKYKLAFMVECYSQEYNALGSYLYNRMYLHHQDIDGSIFGDVFIMNENEKDIIDFTKDDMDYILDKLKKYQKLYKKKQSTEQNTNFIKVY